MAVQIPGFCGIYFNQPIPSNVKFCAPNDYSKRLKYYNQCGYMNLLINDGYIPKSFMSYDRYMVGLIPGPNDRNNLMNNNYISSLKVGSVYAEYEGDKDEYSSPEANKINEEMVKTCFYNTKTFLENWLKINGKYTSLSRELKWDIYDIYDYDLPNNHIIITLSIIEESDDIVATTSIKVADKFFYNYCEDYKNNQKQGDIDAFM